MYNKMMSTEMMNEPIVDVPDIIRNSNWIPAAIYQEDVLILDFGQRNKNRSNVATTPIRFNGFSVMMAYEGECTIYINHIPYQLRKNMFFVVQERHMLSRIDMSEDFKGYHIVSRWDFTRTAMGNHHPPVKEIIQLEDLPFIITADEESFTQLLNFVRQLISYIHIDDHSYQNSLVMNGLCNLILQLWHITFCRKQSEVKRIEPVTNQEKLTFSFVRMIQRECKTHHDVSYYAEKLCVTPVHLTRMVKQCTGKTATNWISSMLVDEAKMLLHQSGIPIQQISEELNFSDQAAFSKFFKKNTGLSPLEYRRGIVVR